MNPNFVARIYYSSPQYKEFMYDTLSKKALHPQEYYQEVKEKAREMVAHKQLEKRSQGEVTILRPKPKYPRVPEISPKQVVPSEWATDIKD